MSQTSNLQTPARRFSVIGGDGRMTHLAERLAEEGFSVRLLGCGEDCIPRNGKGEDLCICTTLQKAAEDTSALILPLPVSRDGKTVHCPRDPACVVTLDEIADLMNRTPTMTLFGGKIPPELRLAISQADARVTDYYDSPVLQLRNAYITAEAALMTAMELTDHTLRDSSVAVLGYGRIGKYLARLLHAMGASVTVCARREESLFEAAAEGCHPLLITENTPMNGLHPLSHDHAILFNTIPAHVLTKDLLYGLEPNTLLIDLASDPFGVCDGEVREVTARNGLRYLRAPSLPGSYAPRNAGRIIAECILDWSAPAEALRPIPTEGGLQV